MIAIWILFLSAIVVLSLLAVVLCCVFMKELTHHRRIGILIFLAVSILLVSAFPAWRIGEVAFAKRIYYGFGDNICFNNERYVTSEGIWFFPSNKELKSVALIEHGSKIDIVTDLCFPTRVYVLATDQDYEMLWVRGLMYENCYRKEK